MTNTPANAPSAAVSTTEEVAAVEKLLAEAWSKGIKFYGNNRRNSSAGTMYFDEDAFQKNAALAITLFYRDRLAEKDAEIATLKAGNARLNDAIPDVTKQSIYWNARCLLAEKYIAASPCDPDITTEQLRAYQDWQEVLPATQPPGGPVNQQLPLPEK
jgi:hypothetical protein